MWGSHARSDATRQAVTHLAHRFELTLLLSASLIGQACFPPPRLRADAEVADVEVADGVVPADTAAGVEAGTEASDAGPDQVPSCTETDTCECVRDEDCGNDDLCDGVERCVDHACEAGTKVTCAPSGEPCVANVCRPESGLCEARPSPEESACDDGDACTRDDRCGAGADAGVCVGRDPVICAASDVCHVVGVCNPFSGLCTSPPISDGALCEHGVGFDGVADEHGTCVAGACQRLPWVALGGEHACAIFFDGSVRCWGEARAGALGRGDLVDVGDGIGPSVHAAGPLDLGRAADWLAVGGASTCVGSGGAVRCWGYNETGMLGYGDTTPRGSTPATVPALLADLPIGVGVRAVGLGFEYACAITVGGGVRCWGLSPLGYMGVAAVGTGPAVPSIADVGDVELVTDGETFEAVKVVAGMHHACALSKVGRIKCWGEWKYVGLDVNTNVGDDEAPSAFGFVNSTWTATDISSLSEHTCAVTVGGDVYCWGLDHWRVLGMDVPDSTVALAPVKVEIGSAAAVAAGDDFTCMLTTDGRVRCWGRNSSGQLGQGHKEVWGDDLGETPGTTQFVDLGSLPIVQVAVGASTACAVARDGAVRCWGSNLDAQLGIDSLEHIGDEPGELPPDPIVF